MDSSTRFRIRTPQVISEYFDNEVVIINFDNGNYYSLEKVGADIWGLIKNGANLGRIIRGLTRQYEGGTEKIEKAVCVFMDELTRENLIVPDPIGKPESNPEGDPEGKAPGETARQNFPIPRLNRYDDMQDLILLDPIHEVDESGWPSNKPPGRKK